MRRRDALRLGQVQAAQFVLACVVALVWVMPKCVTAASASSMASDSEEDLDGPVEEANGDDDDENNLWYLGVILGLLGSIAINTGNNLQSMGMHQLELEAMKHQTPEEVELLALRHSLVLREPTAGLEGVDDNQSGGKRQPQGRRASSLALTPMEESTPSVNSCDSPVWKIGTVIFVSGSLLNFASYGFAAQSLLASLEAIQFVTNLAFGKFMLGSKVSQRQVVGTVVICAGTILTVMFSAKDTLVLTTSDMIMLYTNPSFIVYVGLELVALVVLHMVHQHFQVMDDAGNPLPYSSVVLQVTYATWSALFGTMSVVQAKCLAQLLAVQMSGEEAIFEHWFTYACLLMWLSLTAVWLYRMNDALSKYDPIFIIPLLQVNFIFFAIVSGGIYFKEFNTFSVTMWIGFWCGVLTIFLGLYLLVPSDEATLAEVDATVEADMLELEDTTDPATDRGQSSLQAQSSFRGPVPMDAGLNSQKGDEFRPMSVPAGTLQHLRNMQMPTAQPNSDRISHEVEEGRRAGGDFQGSRASMGSPATRRGRARRRSSVGAKMQDLTKVNGVHRRGSFLVLDSERGSLGSYLVLPHTTSLASFQTLNVDARRRELVQERRESLALQRLSVGNQGPNRGSFASSLCSMDEEDSSDDSDEGDDKEPAEHNDANRSREASRPQGRRSYVPPQGASFPVIDDSEGDSPRE